MPADKHPIFNEFPNFLPPKDGETRTFNIAGHTIHTKHNSVFDGTDRRDNISDVMVRMLNSLPTTEQPVKMEDKHKGKPVFPDLAVYIQNESEGKKSITYFCLVRVSNSDGDHFFTPVLSRFRYDPTIHDDRTWEKFLMESICTFNRSAYAAIMCQKPDPAIKDPVTGKPIFELDQENPGLSESRRMFRLMHPLQANSEGV